MKHLTRRGFGKAMACGIGALSVPISLAVPTPQAEAAASSVRPSVHSLENRLSRRTAFQWSVPETFSREALCLIRVNANNQLFPC